MKKSSASYQFPDFRQHHQHFFLDCTTKPALHQVPCAHANMWADWKGIEQEPVIKIERKRSLTRDFVVLFSRVNEKQKTQECVRFFSRKGYFLLIFFTEIRAEHRPENRWKHTQYGSVDVKSDVFHEQNGIAFFPFVGENVLVPCFQIDAIFLLLFHSSGSLTWKNGSSRELGQWLYVWGDWNMRFI